MDKQCGIIISISEYDEEEARYFSVQYYVSTGEDEDFAYDDDEDEIECDPDFVPSVSVMIRELSASDVEFLENNETDDDDEFGTEVCTLRGWLVLAALMREHGYDPHDLCDEQSQDLEYCWSALNDESISPIANTFLLSNVFYVDTIEIEPDYLPKNDETEIVVGLLADVIRFVNDAVTRSNPEDEEEIDIDELENKSLDELLDFEEDYHIDVIAYYPRALPYDTRLQQMQTDIACGIVSSICAANAEKVYHPQESDEETKIEIRVAPELYLRAAGMRVSGDTYPESAKNREEWDLLESAGWYECGNSRLLYKTCDDD